MIKDEVIDSKSYIHTYSINAKMLKQGSRIFTKDDLMPQSESFIYLKRV